jgi:hypothetical protein
MPEETKYKIDDESMVSLLNVDIEAAQSLQIGLAEDRAECYARYRQEAYGNERTGWSSAVSPVVYNYVQWSMPNLLEIFNEDFFVLRGRDEKRASNFQKLLYYQMFRKQDGFRRFYDFLFDAEMYHYSVFKVFYKEDFDLVTENYEAMSADEMLQLVQQGDVTVSKYDEVTDELGDVSYEKVKAVRKKVLYAGPSFEVVPPWEFFYSPDCKIGDWGEIKGRLVFHEFKTTLNEIKRKENAGIYRKGTYDKIKAKIQPSETPVTAPDEMAVLYDSDEVSNLETQAPDDNELAKELKIKECYYRYDIDGDGLLEPVIVDLYDDVILRLEENPYGKPCFRLGSISPEPHKVVGIAMPNILDNTQRTMTNLLRLIQDSAAQSCYRNPVTSDQQMFQMLQGRFPFSVIKGDPTKVGEISTGAPSQFVLKAYELLKGENEENTGNTRYNQGLDASSLNKTATGINAIFTASGKRMRMTARLLSNGPIMGVIRDFIFINQKWPTSDPINLLGQNIEINPADLDGEYDISIDIGVSPEEKQQAAQQLDLLIQFGTQAGIQMGVMKPVHILRAQKKKYSLINIPVDDLMVTEQELEAAILQQQAQMQQGPPPPPGQQEPSPAPPPLQ